MPQEKYSIADLNPYRNNNYANDAWLGLGDLEKYKFPRENPLIHRTSFDIDNPGFQEAKLMMNIDYVYYAAKVLLNIELAPFQCMLLEELGKRPFPMLIMSRGGSKSFCLALYALLKAIQIPGHKIVICGAAFRQSKIVFEYMETIWSNAPVLRDICDKDSGPRRENDRCTMRINSSRIIAIPLGTGEKIRGLRAGTILTDEFGCLTRDTLIQTTSGLMKIENFLNGYVEDLINMDDKPECPDKIFRTPMTDVYQVTTKNGYSFKCSSIHKAMTINGWKLAKDLTNDDFLELTTNDYFPTNYVKVDDLTIDENLGWLLGVLVSEGTTTNRNYIIISNTDYDMIQEAKDRLDVNWKEYTREAYTDHRGWKCKKSYRLQYNNTEFRQTLKDAGLDYCDSHRKMIPWSILQSPRSVIIEFLRGLFWGDGSSFKYKAEGKEHVGVSYYSVNEELISTLQVLLLKFGITCTKTFRRSGKKSKEQWMLSMRALNAIKVQDLLNLDKWQRLMDGDFFKRHPYIRPNGKRLLVQTTRANKNVHLGTFDTEEECVEAFDKYWENARPCFRVKKVEKLPEQQILYDFHMPETHSFYGNGFVQHNSIDPDIYETVISGFGVVSEKPIDNMKKFARRKVKQETGKWSETDESIFKEDKGNQAILSGTCTYDFQHFADYWRRYKAIVESRGDESKLMDIFGENLPEHFDWQNFSVIRVPYELIPSGFMDDKTVSRSKAVMHTANYTREYAACFPKDSMGFFPRSLIESCVCSEQKPISTPMYNEVIFDGVIKGRRDRKYVFGVDTAALNDNFSIVILELFEDHIRIVYCWTTNMQDFKKRQKSGIIKDHDYYGFCARKIRSLMSLFPTENVGIDSQGGGLALGESLRDPDKMSPGDQKLWPVIDEDKEQDTDDEQGFHILHMVNFANANWTAEANHGLKKDMHDKVILFPRFDGLSMAMATDADARAAKELGVTSIYDSVEDCVMEIEELKDELSTIVMTRTGSGVSGREKWDTPEIQIEGKKGRLRKDRYSGLVIADMIARQMFRTRTPVEYDQIGGFSDNMKKSEGGPLYSGPDWFMEQMGDSSVYNSQIRKQ